MLKGHQLVLFSSITFQAMYKSAVLGGVLILLAISGCVRPPDEEVERRFQLPDSLGNLSIRLIRTWPKSADGSINLTIDAVRNRSSATRLRIGRYTRTPVT